MGFRDAGAIGFSQQVEIALHLSFAGAMQHGSLIRNDPCRTGAKKLLIEKIDERFRSARQRRRELERDPGLVEAALRRGAERARGEARETMRQVREAVGLR